MKYVLILFTAFLWCGSVVAAAELSPESARLAQQLRVSILIDKINILQKAEPTKDKTETAVELLSLHQKLDFRLTVASLQVEQVIAAIDTEDTRADELRFTLENRRDKALKLNSLANIIGAGGLGSIGSAVGISNDNAGNIINTVGAGVNGAIATAAYKETQDTSVRLRRVGFHPNMLAAIFGFQSGESNTFPASVWTFLNGPDDNNKQLTRREALIRSWVSLGRIAPLTHEAGKKEAALIAGVTPGVHELTISRLDDRSAMLSDLRAVVSLMKRNLLELMLALSPDED
jgi:hypothetical protein